MLPGLVPSEAGRDLFQASLLGVKTVIFPWHFFILVGKKTFSSTLLGSLVGPLKIPSHFYASEMGDRKVLSKGLQNMNPDKWQIWYPSVRSASLSSSESSRQAGRESPGWESPFQPFGWLCGLGSLGTRHWGKIVCGTVDLPGTAVAGPPDPGGLGELGGLGFRDAGWAQQLGGVCLRRFPETPAVPAAPPRPRPKAQAHLPDLWPLNPPHSDRRLESGAEGGVRSASFFFPPGAQRWAQSSRRTRSQEAGLCRAA